MQGEQSDVQQPNDAAPAPPRAGASNAGKSVLSSDLKITGDITSTGAVEVHGEVDGTILYKTNNLPLSGSDAKLVFGYKGAATFAEQIHKTEAYSPERRFGDAVKGLHVYGAKVTRPYALVRLVATQGT